jgi:dihydrofolate reductase
MRKLLVSNVMSFDGFFAGPNGELDWHVVDNEFFAYAAEMLRSIDTIILGRLTYEVMFAHWPSAPKDEIAEKMNGSAKVVFSRTLDKADWNNTTLLKGDLVDEVSKLKRLPGKDMVVLGSASIASPLLEAGLVDDYRVIINPVLLGRGKPLFTGIETQISLKLLGTKLFGSGVVLLRYRKA